MRCESSHGRVLEGTDVGNLPVKHGLIVFDFQINDLSFFAFEKWCSRYR
jgi:hypothetical protein